MARGSRGSGPSRGGSFCSAGNVREIEPTGDECGSTHRRDVGRVLAEADEVVLERPEVIVRQQVERLDGCDASLGRMPELRERDVSRVERGGDGGGATVAVEWIEFRGLRLDVSAAACVQGGRT